MKGRKVHRDNTLIYPDLIYVWCYRPDAYWGFHGHITEASLYKKHICGIGFYTRYHARHVLVQLLGQVQGLHLISGKRLIKQGITSVPKRWAEYVFVDGKPRKIKRWIYPPEFRYDSHRRRHFIVYLVRSAEDQGKKHFDIKYKRYFYGYRQSFSWRYYKRKEGKILNTVIQNVWQAHGFRPEDFQ